MQPEKLVELMPSCIPLKLLFATCKFWDLIVQKLQLFCVYNDDQVHQMRISFVCPELRPIRKELCGVIHVWSTNLYFLIWLADNF